MSTTNDEKIYYVDIPVDHLCLDEDTAAEYIVSTAKKVAEHESSKNATHISFTPTYWDHDSGCGWIPNAINNTIRGEFKDPDGVWELDGVMVTPQIVTKHDRDYPVPAPEYMDDAGYTSERRTTILTRHIICADEVVVKRLPGYRTANSTSHNNKHSQLYRAFKKLLLHRETLEFHDDCEVSIKDYLCRHEQFDCGDKGRLLNYLFNMAIIYRVSDGALFFRRYFS